MKQIVVPDAYGYWFDIVKCVVQKKPLPIQEANLVGGRSSCKSTTIFLVIALMCYMAQKAGVKLGIVFCRNQINDKDQLIDDVTNSYETYEVENSVAVKSGKMSIYGSEIRFVGVNDNRKGKKARKAGFARFSNVDYMIVFFEERYEFVDIDTLSFLEAIRPIKLVGAKEPELLVINSCNPWAKSSPYIGGYCGKHMSWDVNILKTTGSQVSIVDIPLGEGKTKRALFHYTNWRVGKGFVSEMEIRKILDTWNYDKKRAATVDWGLPGYEEGAIYTHVLNHIGKAVWQEHEYLFGGGDYGWGRDASSGKTAFYFGGWTLENGLDVYNEFITDNHERIKTPAQVANEVVDFYLSAMREYCNRVGWTSAFNTNVRVDNMADGLIQILNDVARSKKLNWLRFTKCKKYPINDRIEIALSSFARQRVRFSDTIKLLKAELEMSYYESGVTQKRAKVNDHGINGFEYMIEPIMYQEAKVNDLTAIASKRSKIW